MNILMGFTSCGVGVGVVVDRCPLPAALSARARGQTQALLIVSHARTDDDGSRCSNVAGQSSHIASSATLRDIFAVVAARREQDNYTNKPAVSSKCQGEEKN